MMGWKECTETDCQPPFLMEGKKGYQIAAVGAKFHAKKKPLKLLGFVFCFVCLFVFLSQLVVDL